MSSLSLSSLSLSSSTDPVLIEVHRQLCATRDRLTHWQADCVDRLLAQPESRLQQKLVAYINNVADVEAFEADIAQSTAIAPSPLQTPVAAPIDAASHTAADDEEDEDAPAAAPKEIDPVKAHLIAPKRTHPSFEACIIDATLTLMEEEWNQLFNQCTTADGKRISKAERNSKGLNVGSLTYGEITFKSLGEVFWHHLPLDDLRPNGVFVDLGSGTGRGVLAASYLLPFSKLVGVEILEGLHQAAIEVHKLYDSTVRTQFPPDHIRSTQTIDLHCGSFLDFDWQSDADLVFANSTCFSESLMHDIAVQGEKLRDGTYVITFTKYLISPYFKLIYSEQHMQSWGNATVNIMKKVTPTPNELKAWQEEKARDEQKRARRMQRDE